MVWLFIKANAVVFLKQELCEANVQILWYGGETTDQDVAIRLVSSRVAINDEENEDYSYLAIVKVHSSRLVMCSAYFAAIWSQRWG